MVYRAIEKYSKSSSSNRVAEIELKCFSKQSELEQGKALISLKDRCILKMAHVLVLSFSFSFSIQKLLQHCMHLWSCK